MYIVQGKDEIERGIHYEYNPSDKPLGEGGMGIVYRGWRFDEYSGQQREVAIKVLHQGLPQHVIARARREASLQMRNDNLIEMIGFVEVDSQDMLGVSILRYFVISEFLHGTTLESLMRGNVSDYQGHVIPFAQELYGLYQSDPYHFALKIIRSLLSGLMALHDFGYIHRDIDPSNIMITADGHIKLIDFGIAKNITGNYTDEASYTQVGQFIGKPKYAAPELARGLTNSLGVPTDLYGVGILLFQLITGHVPFDGEMAEVLEMQINKNLPLKEIKQAKLRNLIRTATEKNKNKRFQSAAEFRVALDQLIPLSYPEKASHYIPIISIAAIVFVAIGWYYNNTRNNPSIIDPNNKEVQNIKFVELNAHDEYLLTLKMLKAQTTSHEGLDKLERLTNSTDSNIKYKATFLLSRIYFNNEDDISEIPDSVINIQKNLGIKSDNKRAHQLLVKSINLNENDYQSLYELGCDFMSRGKRGTKKDLTKAKKYLLKADSLAKEAGDHKFIMKISKRKSILNL